MNIVITGASKGLGFAIAERFADDKQQHTFFLCARKKRDLVLAAESLQSRYTGVVVHVYACDMSAQTEIGEFAAWLLHHTKSIDVLINNTGQFLPGSIADEPDGRLESMLNINLYSAYYLTRALLPTMKAAQQGHIINISSIAALQAYKNGSSYSISKYALMGFSKNLREELKGENIKVTTVFPGSFMSDSWRGSDVDPNRIMEAKDVAEAIYSATLLSPQACIEEIVLRPQKGDL